MVTATEDELACQELVEIVSDYLEGALPEADRERFEAHLEICEGCRRYLDQMRTTIRVVGTLTEETWIPVLRISSCNSSAPGIGRSTCGPRHRRRHATCRPPLVAHRRRPLLRRGRCAIDEDQISGFTGTGLRNSPGVVIDAASGPCASRHR